VKRRHFDRIGNGGIEFTELGFGSAPLGNLYKAVSDAQAHDVLEAAWNSGCRYFDTAPLYGLGLAETRLNSFLRSRKRDEYVVTTKAGRLLKTCKPEERTGIGKFFETPTRREVFDYSYDGVMRSFEASLERLGLDGVEILLAHDLCIFSHGSKAASDARIEEFMRSGFYAMLSLRDQGVIKAFGAGVNEWQVCQTLAERGDFDLFLLAGRYTLLEQDSLKSFLPLCQKRGIGIILGGPYNSGILASGPKEGAYYNYSAASAEVIERVTRIQGVCARHGVTMISAALQFPLFNPSVVSVIPGGQSVAEVIQNREILNVNIPAGLWHELKHEGLIREDAPTP
jgi:D-threo-aldose 1-dehydrogenase